MDLPPSVTAKPLPVSKSAKSNGIFSTDDSSASTRKSNKRKRNKDNADDTPKAFARLMAMQQGQKLRSGLDDGIKKTKKQKKADAKPEAPVKLAGENHAVEVPTIKPGERMSDFSARVDAALPISGLINKTGKGGKDPLGLKVGRTKTEKRMHRMYDEWREEERKIQEKREEARELAEEEEDEEGNVKWKIDEQIEQSKKKGKKRKKAIGEIDDGDDDPWAVLIKKRNEGKIGLNDVAQAPPTFTKVPKEKFKVRGARVDVEDVPKAAGSLRRREELGEVRMSIIEQYRQMMKENRDRAGQAPSS